MNIFKRSAAGRAANADHEAALAALDQIVDPLTGKGLAASGRVQALSVREGRAGFVMEVAADQADAFAPVREAAEAALRALPGVQQAQVILTAERAAAPARAAVARPRAAALSPELQAQGAPTPSRGAVRPDHVRHVLAVASGKGGVGKSTVAVNLALAFTRSGLRVGLLDADVYGPSAPRMLGLSGKPTVDAEKKIIPLQAHGLKVMTIGVLVEQDAAMIWRGPMATSAVRQMATGVAWGIEAEPLDVLVVDLPPGTGDIQLTLVQRIALTGAVLVSTPQALALDDVRRGASLFARTGVPVLGVVENMAWLDTPAGRLHPFGEGGARRFAEDAGLPFLGELPLDPALREAADAGRPPVTGASASAFDTLAERLAPALA